jgi:N-acetyl-gamma-glutamyl-phosphate reductase
MAVSVAIIGASGYTGGELARLLVRHPEVDITHVTSERFAGQPLSDVFPHLRGHVDLPCHPLNAAEVAEKCTVAFCALPHVTSMRAVPVLLAAGCKVVDLSADFRLKEASVYQAWYDHPHEAPELLEEAAYGLPEWFRTTISSARLVANPGCYPTSVILALGPLLEAGWIDPKSIVIDSKSGASGAGRSPSQATLFTEVSEGFRAYKVAAHRHTPEMEQILGQIAGQTFPIRFTPHLLPQNRGILSTCYVRLRPNASASNLEQLYHDRYGAEPFVRVLPEGHSPCTAHVRGSNYCDLAWTYDQRSGWLVVLSAIDNVVKGAAGQAIQNMNRMLGMPEPLGLEQLPLFP